MKGKRSFHPLSLYERERLAVYRAQGFSCREIAKRLSRHHSTISRELKRNNKPHELMTGYVASSAQTQAQRRKQKSGQRCRLSI